MAAENIGYALATTQSRHWGSWLILPLFARSRWNGRPVYGRTSFPFSRMWQNVAKAFHSLQV